MRIRYKHRGLPLKDFSELVLGYKEETMSEEPEDWEFVDPRFPRAVGVCTIENDWDKHKHKKYLEEDKEILYKVLNNLKIRFKGLQLKEKFPYVNLDWKVSDKVSVKAPILPHRECLTQEAYIEGEKPKMRDLPMCSICLRLIDKTDHISALSCKHLFHLLCIVTWLNYKNNCPICRKDINLLAYNYTQWTL